MGPIGIQEMMGIFLIALLLFGPKKLPELGRTLGKGLREFRKVKDELRTTFETHMRELEREARLAELSAKSTPAVNPYPAISNYPYPYEDSVATGPTAPSLPVAPSVPQLESSAAVVPPSTAPSASPVNGSVSRSGVVVPPASTPAEQEYPA